MRGQINSGESHLLTQRGERGCRHPLSLRAHDFTGHVAWRTCFYILACRSHCSAINIYLPQYRAARFLCEEWSAGPPCECVLTRGGGWGKFLCPRSRSGALESLLPAEQLDSQHHMLDGGQLVCERAEAQDSNC